MNAESTERVLLILKEALEKQGNSIDFESLKKIFLLETDTQFAEDRQKVKHDILLIVENEINHRMK